METLWNGGPTLEQAPGVFPMGTDSVVLADFARPGPRDRVLDLGAGSGILPILLAFERPELAVTAVELDEAACELAVRNLRRSGLMDRVTLIRADLRDDPVPAGAFDLVISNPPYFREESGYVSPALGGARSDRTCTLRELCGAAGRALRWGGSFCLVFRPERFCDLLAALRDCGLFDRMAYVLCGHIHQTRLLSAVLVLLCFFTSMLITNDVALLTFVPFTLALLGAAAGGTAVLRTVVLETVAANLGSMLTPLGNPQNLFLFSRMAWTAS